ncbi:hypothetical protein [Paraburkholderia sp. BL6669N2]|nr:hypothetical protein [Paraburkholderia sp. BL6669N2]
MKRTIGGARADASARVPHASLIGKKWAVGRGIDSKSVLLQLKSRSHF